VAGVVGDVIAWFWLGSRISRAAFIFVLICVDILLLLLAAIEYDTKRMAKKKIRESEQKGLEQQGEDEPH
jgi:signal transduction histidine kinase